jgi:uncharacterized protein (DUF169 family)
MICRKINTSGIYFCIFSFKKNKKIEKKREEEDSKYNHCESVGNRRKHRGLLSNREYHCDSKHGKRCLVFEIPYYPQSVTE